MECVLLLQSMKSGQIVLCKTATSFWFIFVVANRANAVKVFISQTEFLLALAIGLMDLVIPAEILISSIGGESPLKKSCKVTHNPFENYTAANFMD